MFHNKRLIQRPFAVITNATHSLEKLLAKEFASKGFDLIITDKTNGLHKLKEYLSEFNCTIETYCIDLGTKAGVEELYAAIKSFGHPLDALVFHARNGPVGPYIDTDLDEEMTTIHDNVLTPICLLKLILKDMAARNRGKVLITTDLGPSVGASFEAVAGATRSFLFSFTEAIREEVRAEGVSITTLIPGPYDVETKYLLKFAESPETLSLECFDAMMSGKDYVFEESLKTRFKIMMKHLRYGTKRTKERPPRGTYDLTQST